MKATIRTYKPSDEQAIVWLSLRAWQPVFTATENLIGSELLLLLRGDWRAGQAKQIRDVLADSAYRVWIAEAAGVAVGFVRAARSTRTDSNVRPPPTSRSASPQRAAS